MQELQGDERRDRQARKQRNLNIHKEQMSEMLSREAHYKQIFLNGTRLLIHFKHKEGTVACKYTTKNKLHRFQRLQFTKSVASLSFT